MKNLKYILYYYVIFISCMWMAYTRSWVEASYEDLPRNPLDGSTERWPGAPVGDWADDLGVSVSGNEKLARLLDVGAMITDPNKVNPGWSFVPPLDGTSPTETLPQDQYAMKLVLFDLQLVELKNVDPVGGSFEVQFQMVLHWMEVRKNISQGLPYSDECKFICDTMSPLPLCCDGVWVPTLHLPGCDINKIQSSTGDPYLFRHPTNLNGDCFRKQGSCVWRRLWYLNIDATCATSMDFHNFPFDTQSLTIEFLNPYASRTWFQLTNGILQQNIGTNINNANLSADAKILGWHVKDLTVSNTCNSPKSWKQTFLNQDSLLKALNPTYISQKDEIIKSLDPEGSTCSIMEDFNNGIGDIDFSNFANYTLYQNVKLSYIDRINATLKAYEQCTKENGTTFYWNLSSYKENESISIPNFGYFRTSKMNVIRSFSILDLLKENDQGIVSFPCAISAIANLTTPGFQVNIIIKRYTKFYVVKLMIPTIACVILSFSASGFHPNDLVGRLTVVVPSAIALTALQGFVVSTDIPPIAYMAPSTYIFLLSYLVQILISFESVLMNRLHSRSEYWSRRGWTLNRRTMSDASIIIDVSNWRLFQYLPNGASNWPMFQFLFVKVPIFFQLLFNRAKSGPLFQLVYAKASMSDLMAVEDGIELHEGSAIELAALNPSQESNARVESEGATNNNDNIANNGSQEDTTVANQGQHNRYKLFYASKRDISRVLDLYLLGFFFLFHTWALSSIGSCALLLRNQTPKIVLCIYGFAMRKDDILSKD